MASRSKIPQSQSKIPQSKIPKFVSPSPRIRTPSFLTGETPPSSQVNPKTGTPSNTRNPISFRTYPVSSTPNSVRPTIQQSSIKSKSNGETSQRLTEPAVGLPEVMEPAQSGQGGEGDMPCVAGTREATERGSGSIRKQISDSSDTNDDHVSDTSMLMSPVPNNTYNDICVKDDYTLVGEKPQSQGQIHLPNENSEYLTSKSVDASVNVLYAANPIRMESSSSVSYPYRRKSVTYLDLYHGGNLNLESSEETVGSLDANLSDDINKASFQWDYTHEQCREIDTQTSRTLGTVDRASSAQKLGTMDKASSAQKLGTTVDQASSAQKLETTVDQASSAQMLGITVDQASSAQMLGTLNQPSSAQMLGTANLTSSVQMLGVASQASSSSIIPAQSCSTESLLENQTTPLAVLDAQTTENEESEVDCAIVAAISEDEGDNEEVVEDELYGSIIADTQIQSEIQVEEDESQGAPLSELEDSESERCSYLDESDYETGNMTEPDEVFNLDLHREVTLSHEFISTHSGNNSMSSSSLVREKKVQQSSASSLRQETKEQESSANSLRQETKEQESSVSSLRQETKDQESSASSLGREKKEQASSASSLRQEKKVQQSSVISLDEERDVTQQTSIRSLPRPQDSATRYRINLEKILSSNHTPLQENKSVPSKVRLPEWQAEKLTPKLAMSPSSGAVEIQPTPALLMNDGNNESLMNLKWEHEKAKCGLTCDQKESQTSNKVFLKSSTIILHQDSPNFGKGMKGSVSICNSTSFVHGYKILLNHAASKDLKFTPEIGLIPPHGEVSVNVASNHSAICTNNDAAKYCVWIKVFRAYCDDAANLKDFYNKLEGQYPELITKIRIENFIAYNNDNLTEMMNMINSVKDKKERETLKEELYRQTSTDLNLNEESSNSHGRLKVLKRRMQTANKNLRDVFEELCYIRNTVMGIAFISLCIFGMLFVLPYFMTPPELVSIAVVEEQVPTSFTEKVEMAYNLIMSHFKKN